MIPFQGNVLGIMMFVVAALIAGAGSLLLNLSDPLTMSGVGAGLIAMDVVIRFRSRTIEGWVTRRDLGGYLFFAPVWAVGIFVVVMNVVSRVRGI